MGRRLWRLLAEVGLDFFQQLGELGDFVLCQPLEEPLVHLVHRLQDLGADLLAGRGEDEFFQPGIMGDRDPRQQALSLQRVQLAADGRAAFPGPCGAAG